MTAANKKFRQLHKKIHAWKAMDHVRDGQFKTTPPAKVSTNKWKCRNCGHIMFYQSKTCPNCDKTGMFEELKE